MKIAVPIENGVLTRHFGHAPAFALYSVGADKKTISIRIDLPAPPHEPGKLPVWLANHGVNHILAGGIGQRAINLLAEHNIDVTTGVCISDPNLLVAEFLNGRVENDVNQCHHGGGHGHHHHDGEHHHCEH